MEITPETKNTSEKLCSPSNALQSQFRMRIIPRMHSTGKDIADTAYTDTVSVKFKNKVNVNTKITDDLSGDYAILTTSGSTINKKDGVLSNTAINIQAIAPTGKKFQSWTWGLGNSSTDNPISLTVVSDTSLKAQFQPDVSEITVVSCWSS